MGVKMTNSEIKCEQLRKLFEDHYWDTFESDKKIILKHIDFVLSLWNLRTPEPTKDKSMLSRVFVGKKKALDSHGCWTGDWVIDRGLMTEIEQETNSGPTKAEKVLLSDDQIETILIMIEQWHGIKWEIARPLVKEELRKEFPTKAENGLVNKEIDKLVTDYCIRVRDWCKQNRVEYVGDFLIAPTIENFIKDTIIPKFSTPSITKEQLLATIDKAEKEYFSEGAYYRTDIPQGICNHIKQRIEELYNEKIN